MRLGTVIKNIWGRASCPPCQIGLNRHEEGPKPEMKGESEPEKTDHGEDFYFSDTAEISSNAFETVDIESTAENEHDPNCTEIQPLVSIEPTDHDIRFLVKLSQILQQSSVIESFYPAPSSMSNKAQVRSPSRIPTIHHEISETIPPPSYFNVVLKGTVLIFQIFYHTVHQ